MRVIKLTRSNGTTYGGMAWKIGTVHTAKGGGLLCTQNWLHAYETPEQAALCSPNHVTNYPLWWECEATVKERDGTKCGCTRIKVLRKAKPLMLTTEQRVRAAIYLAQPLYKDKKWQSWAAKWMSGEDRSAASAWASAWAADVAWVAGVAAWASAWAADVAWVADKKAFIATLTACVRRAIADEPGR